MYVRWFITLVAVEEKAIRSYTSDDGHAKASIPVCTQPLPLLCIYKPPSPFPPPSGVNNASRYALWSGGVVATPPPVAGITLKDMAAANSYCVAQFGPG